MFTCGTSWAAGKADPPYFQDCTFALETKEFATLDKYFETIDQDRRFLAMCFRLSRDEFVYATAFSFYYCPLRTQSKCVEYDSGRIYMNPQVVQEFRNSKGKRFVLLRGAGLRRGWISESYDVFYLKPRQPDGIPFVIQYLTGAARYESSGDGNDNLCPTKEDLGGETAPEAVSEILDAIVSDEDPSNLQLQFNVLTQYCVTRKKSHSIQLFSYRDGTFVDISPKSPEHHPSHR